MSTNGTTIDAPTEKYRMQQITTHEGLLDVWGFVKKGIERINNRNKSCSHNVAHNQIFNAIRCGFPTAQPRTSGVELYVVIDAKNRVKGFMVTAPLVDPFRNGVPIGLTVWFAYADYEIIEMFLPKVVALCKLNGGDQIEFKSGREGWLRHWGRMAKLGFRIAERKFVLDIQW